MSSLVECGKGPFAGYFARYVRRDESPVNAALTQPGGNGQVEGRVHRLKLIEPSIYSRASFDL